MIKRKIIISILALVCLESSYAYIDPGTGGAIIGSVSPVVAAVFAAIGAFFIKYFWKPIKEFFKSIWFKITGIKNKK